MRRILLLSVGSVLLLSACTWGRLAPAEVMQRATAASRALRSARFDVQGTLRKPDGSIVSLVLSGGILQDAGNQLSFTADIRTGTESGTGTVADVAILHAGEAYVRTRSVGRAADVFPDELRRVLLAARGGWWRVALAEQNMMFVTPDPRLLRAQGEIILVTKDEGIEKENGDSSYHFAIALDAKKLSAFLQSVSVAEEQSFDEKTLKEMIERYAAEGEAWIDTRTFVVRKLVWTFRSMDGGVVRAVIDVRDVNAAPPVTPPQDANVLSLPLLLSDDLADPAHAASGAEYGTESGSFLPL